MNSRNEEWNNLFKTRQKVATNRQMNRLLPFLMCKNYKNERRSISRRDGLGLRWKDGEPQSKRCSIISNTIPSTKALELVPIRLLLLRWTTELQRNHNKQMMNQSSMGTTIECWPLPAMHETKLTIFLQHETFHSGIIST